MLSLNVSQVFVVVNCLCYASSYLGLLVNRYVLVQTFSQCIWNTTPYLVSTCTFFVFALLGNELTTSIAFTSISLFNILRFPLTRFPEVGMNDSTDE